MTLKDTLRGKLSKSELSQLVRGFDIIGDIAIIEIPEPLIKKKKTIADAIMKTHKRIKTVLLKSGMREGRYRLRKLVPIAGSETETLHKEHGCRFLLDVTSCYFSPREATERQRIAEKVKPSETVMIMFAGIGPFPIIIHKKQPEVKTIYAIEINPECVKYMKKNIALNKAEEKIIPILGDVREKAVPYYGTCDRVVMPLPKEAYKYLDVAFSCLKKKGTIHFYHYCHENDLWDEPIGLLKKEAKKIEAQIKITGKRKVLPYAPGVWKVCIDCEVRK